MFHWQLESAPHVDPVRYVVQLGVQDVEVERHWQIVEASHRAAELWAVQVCVQFRRNGSQAQSGSPLQAFSVLYSSAQRVLQDEYWVFHSQRSLRASQASCEEDEEEQGCTQALFLASHSHLRVEATHSGWPLRPAVMQVAPQDLVAPKFVALQRLSAAHCVEVVWATQVWMQMLVL